MKRYGLSKQGARGLLLREDAGAVLLEQFFGMACVTESPILECTGTFFLNTDLGRFEGNRFRLLGMEQTENTLRIRQETLGGEYALETVLTLCPATGVISRKDFLTNRLETETTVYACLPRVTLQGDQFELYGQAAGWCAENVGSWIPLTAGNHILTNTAGRTVDSATPFACIRHKATGLAVALHVLPIGDWIIQARRVAGSRKAHLVIEAGLSDQGLHMTVEPGETLQLPELLMFGFAGEVEQCAEPLQRYLLRRYDSHPLPGVVYNTWFHEFDILDVDRLKEQVLAAKKLGCRTFVIDAGWFGKGVDWANQVGCWEECTERAFGGKMRQFADFVRENGMGFGLWMEPERACEGTEVYETHPEWFLPEDSIVFDFSNPEVREYICDQLTGLVQKYDLCWMKLDFNSDMLRDRTGSNYYRYYVGEHEFMRMINERNPTCSFEGCAGGGLRSDFHSTLAFYHGFFCSDTPHPLETLRIRQGISLRMLTSYSGSWLIMQETPFHISSYQLRNREERTKVFACGDGWWQQTVDVSADFAAKVNLLGEMGLSGDLTSFGTETANTVRKAVEFYHDHQAFMGRSICHLLTKTQPLNDITGWTAMQYENVDGEGSLVFVFRLVDNAESFVVYPKNLEADRTYRVICDGQEQDSLTGAELAAFGITVHCPDRYSARLIELVGKADT